MNSQTISTRALTITRPPECPPKLWWFVPPHLLFPILLQWNLPRISFLSDVAFRPQGKFKAIPPNQQLVLRAVIATTLTRKSWYVYSTSLNYESNQSQVAPEAVWAHRIVGAGIDSEGGCEEEVGRGGSHFPSLCDEDHLRNWTNWIWAVLWQVSQCHPKWLSLLLLWQIGWFWTSWHDVRKLISLDRWSSRLKCDQRCMPSNSLHHSGFVLHWNCPSLTM